jgi:hypothetical protein
LRSAELPSYAAAMAIAKKKTGLADELESTRRPRLETLTFRCDLETRGLLEKLVKRSNARGVGEILRIAVRRLARSEGLIE